MKTKKERDNQFINYMDSMIKQSEFQDNILEKMRKEFDAQIEKEHLEHEIEFNKLLAINPSMASKEYDRYWNDKQKKINDFHAKITILRKQFYNDLYAQSRRQGEINKKEIEELCKREKPSIELQNLIDKVDELSDSWDKFLPCDKKINPH